MQHKYCIYNRDSLKVEQTVLPEDYFSCLVQNLFSLELLGISFICLWCHYAFLGKFYNLDVWTSLYSKVRAILAIRPVHLYGEKFVFSVTAQYVVHTYVKTAVPLCFLCNLNMWIVLALLYSKVRMIFALPYSAVYFY